MAVGIGSLEELGVSSAETALGFGLGVALAESLAPLAASLRQATFSADPSRVLTPGDAARIVAQGLEQLGWGQGEAAASGIDGDRFARLEQAELRAPAIGELLQLIRRAKVTDEEIGHALRKAQLEPTWDDRIRELAQVALTPAEVATAIHRNIFRGTDLIVTSAPSTPGKVPQVPASSLDPVEQAAWWGTTPEQLRVLVGITGLPLSLTEMLTLLRRDAVTEDDVRRAIAQSNTRNEYMDVALQLRDRVLTGVEAAELAIRQWVTDAESDQLGALDGWTPERMDYLRKLRGRPIPVHQVTLGERRGGKFQPLPGEPTDPYLVSVSHGNIRPEFYDLAIAAGKYTYPGPFFFRLLQTTGVITAAEAEQRYLELGWPPDLAKQIADALGNTTAAADKHIAKAQTQLWNALHKAYLDDNATDQQARDDLAAAGVAGAAVPQILALWKRERAIVRRTLSPTDIRKAIGQPGKDQAWALERLKELGYSDADAATFLAE